MKVASLQNISSFTLLESPTTVEQLANNAKKKGYDAVALTDINVTYGLVEFYKAAQKAGIHPLLGMQVRINGLVDETKKFDLIVIAKNNQGFQNILRLSSAVNLLTNNGETDRVLTIEELKKYFEDLVVITPANVHSELRNLMNQNPPLASDYIRKLKTNLGNNSDLYLGVYANSEEKNYINFVTSLSKQFDIPLVAVEDSQYLNPNDQFLRKSLQAIKENTVLNDTLELAKQKGSHYLKDHQELLTEYQALDLKEAVENAGKIAEICKAKVTFQSPNLPKFKQNHFPSSKEYLRSLAQKGLEKKFKGKSIPQTYKDRLNYELKVISEMGFDDYFLIVWDVINYAHSIKITTGPGRGSAAGSLVSYALDITKVDPLKYNLLFERFLNPARQQMPDIDLDIPDNRRDEIITYMFKKYGMDHVAQILTFGTLAAKQSLRDVSRIFGLNVFEAKKWTQALPYSKEKISLRQAYDKSNDLRLLVNSSKFNQLLFATASHLEDLPRHYSIHAAGLVLTDNSLAKIVGLQAGPLGIPVTQQTKLNVEKLGLLKIDFLGLRTLTILGKTLDLLRKEGIDIDPDKIPLDDQATLRLFQDGKTDAIFQFESDGIKQVLRRLHPDNFEDIVAVDALYRPGPIQNIGHFIDRKFGREKVEYPDSSLEKILSPTYGIMVYQEQVMQTAQALAGFTLGEADLLRRAMSKKDEEVINAQRLKFIDGAQKLGHSKEVAEKVYNYIAQFAHYGFNRSHAVAYTKIAFWLAYLKVHYPAAFYTALVNSNIGDKNKVYSFFMEAQDAGIKILPPDINKSEKDFSLLNGQILVGFRAIKGLRRDFVDQISNIERPVKSLADFLIKVDSKYLNQSAIDSLIKAGVFDNINENRNSLLATSKDLIDTVKMAGNNETLFETLEPKPVSKPMPDNSERAQMEVEAMGFSTGTNPLLAVQKYAKRYNAKKLKEFIPNESGIGVGKLIKLKPITTKNDKTMAFATFTDSEGPQEFIIFPNVYEEIKDLLKIGDIYLLKIRTQNNRYDAGKIQFLLNSVRKVNFKD